MIHPDFAIFKLHYAQQQDVIGKMENELEKYQGILFLKRNDFIEKYKIAESSISWNVSYEKLTGLNRIAQPETINGYFYFRDDAPMLIYISAGQVADGIWNAFKNKAAAFLAAGVPMRSRSGKTANHIVFANQGLAISLDHNEVRFIELFPPRPLDKYLSDIYKEPPLFRK